MSKLNVSQLKPLAGYVLVEPSQAETKTASGIILPGSDTEKPQYGKVLAIGDQNDGCCGGGCGDFEMKKTIDVKVGDLVVYKKWGGNDVMIDDVEYQFLKYEDILAVVDRK